MSSNNFTSISSLKVYHRLVQRQCSNISPVGNLMVTLITPYSRVQLDRNLPEAEIVYSLHIYHYHHYFFTLVSRCFFSALASFLICTFINLVARELSSSPAESSLYPGAGGITHKGLPWPTFHY